MIIIPPLDPLPDFEQIEWKYKQEIVQIPKPIKRRRGKKIPQQELQIRIDILNEIIYENLHQNDAYYNKLKYRYESMLNEQDPIIVPTQNTENPRFVNKVFQAQQHNNVYNLINSENYQSMITTIQDLRKMISILEKYRSMERPLYMNSVQISDDIMNNITDYYKTILSAS